MRQRIELERYATLQRHADELACPAAFKNYLSGVTEATVNAVRKAMLV